MITKIVTPPTVYPVSLDEAKEHLVISSQDDNTYVNALIAAATNQVENLTGRKLITQTWKSFYQEWDEFTLPYGQLQSVTGVYYVDSDGDTNEWTTADYDVDTNSDPGKVKLGYNKTYPTDTLDTNNPIYVQYVCGYGLAASVPDELKHAIKLLIAHHYENREPVIVGHMFKIAMEALPFSVDALTMNHRIFYI